MLKDNTDWKENPGKIFIDHYGERKLKLDLKIVKLVNPGEIIPEC